MAEMTFGQRQARGQQAARILEDEVFKAALAAVEEKCISTWRTAKKVDERERQFAILQASGEVVGALEAYVLDGQLADREESRKVKK